MALPYTRLEAKAWAKENFKGLEAPIFPSYSPDLSELDEDGIRWDVNHIIANGMISIMIAPEATGMTREERKRFVAIVNDEAKGRIITSVGALLDTVEENIEMMQHHEKTGGTMALLGHPIVYDPESEEELYRNYKYMADATNLAVNFYPGRLRAKRFHPSGWPMSILPRIADIPNVVAMKFAGGTPLVQTVQSFLTIGDRVLVSDPMPDAWFITMPKYGQQWAGAGPFYCSQTPEDQRSVKLFNLLLDNRIDEAYEAYWQSVARMGGGDGAGHMMNTYLETGLVSPVESKYGHWCLGGNGGLVRQPARRLYDFTREGIKAGIRAMGFTPREPEEEFFVGRMNYAKGARLKRY
jgi:4-hydroxy-tetrahydrodipicolinate synthase